MSNTKYFADLVKVCSVLPVFAVMPAMAEELIVTGDRDVTYKNTAIDYKTSDVADVFGIETTGNATVDFDGDRTSVSIISDGATNVVAAVRNFSGATVNFDSDETVFLVDGAGKSVVGARVNGDGSRINFYDDTRISMTGNPSTHLRAIDATDGASVLIDGDMVLDLNGGDGVREGVIGILASGADSVDLSRGNSLNINASGAREVTGIYAQYGATFNVAEDAVVNINSIATAGDAYGYIGGFAYGNVGTINSRGKLNVTAKGKNGYGFFNFGGSVADVAQLNLNVSGADSATGIYVTDYDWVGGCNDTTNVVIGTPGASSSIIAYGALENIGIHLDKRSKDVAAVLNGDFDIVADTGIKNAGTLTLNGEFALNTTKYGIYNTGKLIVNDELDFAENSGAAIHNKGEIVFANGIDLDFDGHYSEDNGAAVYNSATGVINALTGDFESNKVTTLAKRGIASGGAIMNGGKIGTITGNFSDNVVGAFGENTSSLTVTAKGGAIYSWADKSAHATIDSIVADFNGNQAVSAGDAIGGAIVNDGKIGTLYQAANGFVNNTADGQNYGLGGAFHNSEYAEIDELVADFVGNSANGDVFANGGALMNKGRIELLTGRFENNSVTNAQYVQGGAIYNATNTYDENAKTAELTIIDSVFANNFVDSVDATWAEGGAIYNEPDSFITLKGTNTFTGNTVNGVANDIYNDGTLTIASGMTSIDGGINGAGARDIQSDATLNMNYASIEQGTINIDGTLMASLLNDKDSVDVTGALSGAGNVLLSAGAAGVYDVSQFTDANLSVDFGKTYQTSIVDGIATLTARQAAEIAADTGASVAAAGAVSGLANVTDAKLQQVSLMMQEALNSGDIETVEQEVAKVNPNKKPVGQSVSSSVQNQVLTVAAGRMSTVGGSTGRAGGDVTGAGVWAQGMFNKTKMGSAFEGNSRGFAMGGDTLIDNVFTLGGGYAYSSTNVLGGGRDIDVESNSIFVYGQYKPAAWYVNSTLTYTESEYSDVANMAAGFALGSDYDIKAYGAQVMTGYDFASGVTPEVGLRYLHTNQGEHENAFGATVREMDMDFLSGVAGLKYAFEIESDTAVKFSPEMRAAMTYDFISDDATATVVFPGAAAYYVDVDRLSRLGGEFGIGLTAEYRGLELSLNYELDLHKDYTSQTGLFKFRYNF